MSLWHGQPQMRSQPLQALQIPYWQYENSPSVAAEIARLLKLRRCKTPRIARIFLLAKEMLSASLDREE